VLVAALALTGCAGPVSEGGHAASAVAGALTPSRDAWIGRWPGPEGTYLDIRRAGDGYGLTVADLDGARTFPGSATAEGIAFERDGTVETVRGGDGNATGMKWLAGKQDCLIIRAGEGFCRD
jgi:hypothetical protein